MTFPFNRCAAVVVVAVIVCLAAQAETAVFYPVADTTLFEHEPGNNLGAETTLAAGTTAGISGAPARSRALIKFDVAGIPTSEPRLHSGIHGHPSHSRLANFQECCRPGYRTTNDRLR